ncbi:MULTISPECIES: GTP 3',8-cyclase MoaA [Allobranchiibius]|uniref:GTP 3',8-cyclase n=1 Tax=Allobranchiibius huperziae TaxID=1874116 RepID=A0A853DFC9_9MICO|nr:MULTISPECIES: GTP 3',8-cyclase MoaA [Allobranchiibius]MBO1766511.1 GTP 3',8-cyclase MoaA [Allobranchiibius sp. GilTou38]NYJ74733.1 cyclic pyranopterin phosphate synthase [Allobranchiibius huperziae]
MTHTPARESAVLGDRFGRVAADLRVSVTDRCNLRCTYCMPAEGLDWMPRPEMLTDDEMVRVIGLFVDLGVRQVRFTGGEPLLRRSLVDVVRRVGQLPNAPRMAMTTNGIGLDRLAQPLADAGLHRVNVSLDTVSPERFKVLTRRDRFHDVERGLKAAADAGLAPVKVNAVAMHSDVESPADLLAWCLDRGYQLRFIEQMPLDAQHSWDRSTMMTGAQLRTAIEERFTLTDLPAEARGSAPAEEFLVDGGPETVGLIASVSAPFCAACDRVRLTADGQVRNCLFARDEGDLRAQLRSGASDEQLTEVIRSTMWAKAAGHGIDLPGFVQPQRPMSAIGG